MPVSIDWDSKVIYVPKSFTSLVQSSPIEIRELNINDFRLALKDLEDSEQGMVFPDTHRHNTEVSLGGVVYARVVEMINDYTVTFEDGQYALNLVGANSNIADVTNLNSVQIRSSNSAGLILNSANVDPASIASAVWEAIVQDYALSGNAAWALKEMDTKVDSALSALSTIDNEVGSLAEDIGSLIISTVDIRGMVVRALGLSHENFVIDNTVYDSNGQLLSSRVRLFGSKEDALAATDGGATPVPIDTYLVTSIWEGVGQMSIFKQVRV